jgi:hypothetical protein
VNKDTNTDLEYMAFSSKIMEGVEFVEIPISEILLDDEAQKIILDTNPIAGLRTPIFQKLIPSSLI